MKWINKFKKKKIIKDKIIISANAKTLAEMQSCVKSNLSKYSGIEKDDSFNCFLWENIILKETNDDKILIECTCWQKDIILKGNGNCIKDTCILCVNKNCPKCNMDFRNITFLL